jgi:hypothetical protein
MQLRHACGLCAIAHSYLDTDGNGSNGLRVGITLREQFDAIVDTKTVRAAEDGKGIRLRAILRRIRSISPSRVHGCAAPVDDDGTDDLEDSFETFTMSACEVDAAYNRPITNQATSPISVGATSSGSASSSLVCRRGPISGAARTYGNAVNGFLQLPGGK